MSVAHCLVHASYLLLHFDLVNADNPIVQHLYTADPAPIVHGDTVSTSWLVTMRMGQRITICEIGSCSHLQTWPTGSITVRPSDWKLSHGQCKMRGLLSLLSEMGNSIFTHLWSGAVITEDPLRGRGSRRRYHVCGRTVALQTWRDLLHDLLRRVLPPKFAICDGS